MAAVGWRQLPDGSWLNPFTGDVAGLDGQREAAARAISEKRTGRRIQGVAGLAGPGYPTPPLPQQQIVALPGRHGVSSIVDPKKDLLAVSPFELGLGADAAASNTNGRFMVLVGILAVAAGYVWLQNRKKAT